MTLYISRGADSAVKIPITPEHVITVAALRDVDHEVLAMSCGLTLTQFENRIREWDHGVGVSYGVLVRGVAPKTHNYKVVNASLYQSVEEAMNVYAEQGWRVVSVNIDTRRGYGDQIFLERPVGVTHPDD